MYGVKSTFNLGLMLCCTFVILLLLFDCFIFILCLSSLLVAIFCLMDVYALKHGFLEFYLSSSIWIIVLYYIIINLQLYKLLAFT